MLQRKPAGRSRENHVGRGRLLWVLCQRPLWRGRCSRFPRRKGPFSSGCAPVSQSSVARRSCGDRHRACCHPGSPGARGLRQAASGQRLGSQLTWGREERRGSSHSRKQQQALKEQTCRQQGMGWQMPRPGSSPGTCGRGLRPLACVKC